MSFVERVNQGESLASWLNWLTKPPAVCWSVIVGDLSPSWKGVYWTLLAFRMGPPSCAVHSMVWQTIFSDAFSWMKSFAHWLKFHWSLFLRVQLTIFQYWFDNGLAPIRPYWSPATLTLGVPTTIGMAVFCTLYYTVYVLPDRGPLTRYAKLQAANAPGMTGTFSPPLTSKEIGS